MCTSQIAATHYNFSTIEKAELPFCTHPVKVAYTDSISMFSFKCLKIWLQSVCIHIHGQGQSWPWARHPAPLCSPGIAVAGSPLPCVSVCFTSLCVSLCVSLIFDWCRCKCLVCVNTRPVRLILSLFSIRYLNSKACNYMLLWHNREGRLRLCHLNSYI